LDSGNAIDLKVLRRKDADPMTDAEGKSSQSGAPASADLMREQRIQRNLKILVVGMGVLILAGLGAIAFRILQLANKPAGPGSLSSSRSVVGQSSEIGLELPKGAKVVSIAISGNRLAVHHESPTGTGITVIDISSGRRIADVRPLETMPQK
jgi:hypothetical protein